MGEPLLLQLFVASSIPVVKILLICTIGAFCARKGLLTPEGRRVLGALSFQVFNPALIFVKLASTLTPSRLLHWWPLVLNTAISTAVGLGLGYLGVRLVRPPKQLRPHTVVSIALGNLGNLPLVIVSTLASSSAELLQGIAPSRAEDLAVSYVVVGLLVPVIAHATIGFNMLRKVDASELPEAEARAADGDADGQAETPRTAAAANAPAATPADGAKAREASQEANFLAKADAAATSPSLELQKQPLLEEHRITDSSSSCYSNASVLKRPNSGSFIRLYGCTVDSLGQDDVDPLLRPAAMPEKHYQQHHQQQQDFLNHSERSRHRGLSDPSGGELDLDVGAEAEARPVGVERSKGQPAAVAVELPLLPSRPRLTPEQQGSCGDALRSSAAGCALDRPLGCSGSGCRLLQCWRSRVDWRAVGRQVLREVISPPLLAILLSVPVGCVAQLQRAFFGGGSGAGAGSAEAGGRAPLGLLTDCLTMLGDCTIPSILLILGATLANGPGAARVPFRVITLVNVTRLALLPLLGLALVMGAYAARVFEAPDPIYLLVLLIQNTAPTAIMVHTMASVHANCAGEVSSILFWGYISGIAIIPLWLTLFLYVVKLQFRYGDGGALDA
ncbi:hypothetical protein VaNZ11_012303 [Volvox africanus]|uniref:Auxin efflux carrier n=1 Tax=Volvox africanus TaxID=51714 RepID=A0ABQ5SDG0_9CHLO|nr:hypothetical protein VaNZ11_012303 [Volvox africanus]